MNTLAGAAGLIVVATVVLATSPDACALSEQALVESARVEVRLVEAGQAHVAIRFLMESPHDGGAVQHRAILFPDQTLKVVEASSPGGPIRFRTERLGSSDLVTLQPGPGVLEYSLGYRVTGDILRVPIFVARMPAGRPDRLGIEVRVPPGWHLGRDAFPRLIKDASVYRARGGEFPGFLYLPIRTDAGWTPGLNGSVAAGLLAVVVLGAAAFWLVRRGSGGS